MIRLLRFCTSRNIGNIVKFIEPSLTFTVRRTSLFTSFFCRNFTDSGTDMDLSNMRKSYKSDQEVRHVTLYVWPWSETLSKRHNVQSVMSWFLHQTLDMQSRHFLYYCIKPYQCALKLFDILYMFCSLIACLPNVFSKMHALSVALDFHQSLTN